MYMDTSIETRAWGDYSKWLDSSGRTGDLKLNQHILVLIYFKRHIFCVEFYRSLFVVYSPFLVAFVLSVLGVAASDKLFLWYLQTFYRSITHRTCTKILILFNTLFFFSLTMENLVIGTDLIVICSDVYSRLEFNWHSSMTPYMETAVMKLAAIIS